MIKTGSFKFSGTNEIREKLRIRSTIKTAVIPTKKTLRSTYSSNDLYRVESNNKPNMKKPDKATRIDKTMAIVNPSSVPSRGPKAIKNKIIQISIE